jgi:hypothetical protein
MASAGHRRAARSALPLLLFAAAACANVVPPSTRVLAPLAPDLPRVLYATTNAAREDVVGALEQAGFAVASDARETSIVLEVRIGTARTRSDECGALRNMVYTVYQGGVRVAVIKGRGFTGASCHPNVHEEMNAALDRYFGPGRAPEPEPARSDGPAR